MHTPTRADTSADAMMNQKEVEEPITSYPTLHGEIVS